MQCYGLPVKRLLAFGVLLALLAVPASASALTYEVRLPRSEARKMVLETGGHLHFCQRLADRRFRCVATYWGVEHTSEEVEPGVWAEVSSVPVAQRVELSVTLIGVRTLRVL
jgi:hypothetical protein